MRTCAMSIKKAGASAWVTCAGIWEVDREREQRKRARIFPQLPYSLRFLIPVSCARGGKKHIPLSRRVEGVSELTTRRGGVLMESGDGVRMKTAISSFSGGRIPPSSVGIHPPPVRLRANALTLHRQSLILQSEQSLILQSGLTLKGGVFHLVARV